MNKIILLLILGLGLFLRTYKLDVRPLGFTWDEAALGYNAYSLLLSGRDEHGQATPLIFKSFGDYKPGLYIYSAVPTIKLFGLTEFATRLPSAIFGTLMIIIVYLLSRELFSTSHLALSTAFLFAINPWSIYFSRGAWEANLSLFLTTLGVLLFVKYIKNHNSLFLIHSSILFGLTFLTYQGAKMFTPLLILVLLWIYRPKLRLLFKPFFLLLLLVLPILFGIKSQSGRLKIYSVFSYTRPQATVDSILQADRSSVKNAIFYFFHSESLDQFRGVVQRYLNHLSPRFLFIEGDWSNLRHSVPYYGYFHFPEIATVVIGLFALLKTNNSSTKLLLAWLLLSPLPSALSRDIVSGVRSFPLVLPLSLISGMGLSQILNRKFLAILLFPVFGFFLVYYLDLFYIHTPQYTAKELSYPYKPILQLIKPHLNQYDKIVFTNSLGQPYIYVLFYYQIPPTQFQHNAQFIPDSLGDVGEITRFDKYYFAKFYWPAARSDHSAIYIGDQYELPEKDLNLPNLVRLGEINYPNGAPALKAIGLN